MKALIAAFSTSLLVFALAWGISETPGLGETSQSVTTLDRTKTRALPAKAQSTRSASKRNRAESNEEESVAAEDNIPPRTREREREPSGNRQHAEQPNARDESMVLVYQEMRAEQNTVKQLQEQLSLEIAELRGLVIKVSQKRQLFPAEPPAIIADRVNEVATRRPTVSLRDSQAIGDIAVLVRRLIEQGDQSRATELLRDMKERDATKVLDLIADTDYQNAVRLSKSLQAGRTASREFR